MKEKLFTEKLTERICENWWHFSQRFERSHLCLQSSRKDVFVGNGEGLTFLNSWSKQENKSALEIYKHACSGLILYKIKVIDQIKQCVKLQLQLLLIILSSIPLI